MEYSKLMQVLLIIPTHPWSPIDFPYIVNTMQKSKRQTKKQVK
jgi:hypothetical protein